MKTKNSMQSYLKKLILLILSCIFLDYVYADALVLEGIKNPFIGKVLSIKKKVDIPPEHFELLKKEYPDIKNGVVYESILYDNGKVIKAREFYTYPDGLKNTRDMYAKGNTVVCIDSVSDPFIEVSDIDAEDLYNVHWHKNMFFDILAKLENIKFLPNLKIACTKDEIVVNWQDKYDNIAKINLKTKEIAEYQQRHKNGNLSRTISFKKVCDNEWVLVHTSYSDNKLFGIQTLQIKIENDNSFALETEPKGFGYKEVYDNRNGVVRRYIAVDSLPSDEFLDELFKNPDDVSRYNIEMNKFSPINKKFLKK